MLVSVMELQQRFPAFMNEYEESETKQMRGASQTEDVYLSTGTINSTTQFSSKTTWEEWMESINGINLHIFYNQNCINLYVNLCLTEHSERKYVLLLFANILISAIILVIVGLNCKHHGTATF